MEIDDEYIPYLSNTQIRLYFTWNQQLDQTRLACIYTKLHTLQVPNANSSKEKSI